ncbi:MAG: BfmA/BtgA family mobilization protein [Caldisericota bacterium]|nr:BfmA/BtgA family mobilization protein [Caldisericota bacterium]
MAQKSIGISEATAADLAREANKHKVSRDKVISKMLDFFRIYGIDPFNYDAPADEMQKIIKRMDSVVAFMKKQEKDILIPTLTRLSTREDIVKGIAAGTNKTRESLSELLKLLREDFEKVQKENQELKNQLAEARKKSYQEHGKVVSEVSKMLQITMDAGGWGGKKQAIEQLKSYEH